MVVYNIYQLLACVYMIKTMVEDPEARPSEYFSKCQVKQSFKNSTNLYKFTCFMYWLKVSEMSETVVFVLRKKWNQISFLHVFHHSVMVLLIFLGGHSGASKLGESFKFLVSHLSLFHSQSYFLGSDPQLDCALSNVQLLLGHGGFQQTDSRQDGSCETIYYDIANDSICNYFDTLGNSQTLV